MANFCIAAKVQPSEYRKLTLREVNAFVKVLDKRGGSTPLEELI